jgi:ADP-heptose:LPS heptosyltransferase
MSHALANVLRRLETGGNVLVSRLRHLGDVVLSLPLVEALHERFPQAALHYLAEPHAIGAALHHPAITRVWESPRQSLAMWRQAIALRRIGFDVAIDLFANPRSALLVWATGAPIRLGEDRRLRRQLYTHPRHLQPGRSALAQHLAVLEDLGLGAAEPRRPHVCLTDEERRRGRRLLPPGHDSPLVLFHPDASHAAKEWPLANSLDLLRRLSSRGMRVLIGRAPGPRRASLQLAECRDLPPGVVFLTAQPLRDYLGLLAECDAIVSVDGGILHCSVGLGRPTVGLFGPTDASIWFPYESFGPYRVLHVGRIEARPEPRTAAEGCLGAIDAAEVEATLVGVLGAASPTGGGA